MTLQLATQSIAHYLHSSLEQFDRDAVQEIIRSFEVAAASANILGGIGPYSLNYDERDHTFVLVCQNHAGAALDEHLGNVIRDHVATESVGVKRFTECEIADPYDDYEVDLDETDTLSLDQPSLIAHLVNFDGIKVYGKAKAFHLHKLPPALRLRVRSRHENSHLTNAITFCRVRWDDTSEEHVFDGNVGNDLTELSDEQHDDLNWLFDLLTFVDFTANTTLPGHDDDTEDEPMARPWEFVGEPPRLDQWLEGMGETRLVDPGAEPEIQKDALQFASSSQRQQNLQGRVRKPRGATLLEQREPDAEEGPERSETQVNKNFAALLNSRADGDTDTESGESTTDEPDFSQHTKPTNVAKLIREHTAPTIANEGATNSSSTVRQISTNGASTDAVLAIPSSRINGPPNNELGPHSSSSEHTRGSENYPNYTRSYAETDRFGLRGNVANQVAWENENASCLQSRRSTTSLRTYEAVALSRTKPIAMSISNGQDLDAKLAVSKTPMTYKDTVPGGDESWAHRIVPPSKSVPNGILIDTSTTAHGNGQTRAPELGLGQFPPLGSNRQLSTKSLRPTSSQLVENSAMDSSLHEEDDLIQLDDEIVERVLDQTESNQRLHVTMKQQAAKNKKQQKKKAKVSSNKPALSRPATLELPSPPPPPRPRMETAQTANNGPGSFRPNAENTHANEEDIPDRLQQEIEELLLSSPVETEQQDIVIQFGLTLMTDAEDMVDHRASRHDELQQELDDLTKQQRSTSFIAALGRKRKDGMYLLQLPTMIAAENDSPPVSSTTLVDAWTGNGKHTINDRRLYEVTIAVPDGDQWLLIFNQEFPEDVEIVPVDSHQPSIYIHYPLRVWDARIQHKELDWAATGAMKLESDLQQNITTFLQTLNTPKRYRGSSLPMFEACIPDSAFLVTDVLAKRVLTQSLGSGTWVVTQVWDLHVEPGQANVKAFAKDEDDMAREGRLWWEAALQHDGGEELKTLLNDVVSRLDVVGFDGEAIKASTKLKPQTSKKSKQAAYQPFW